MIIPRLAFTNPALAGILIASVASRMAILAAIIIGTALLSTQARAQHVHPDETISDKRVSEFYDSWKRPPARLVSCCHRKDCYSAKIRRGPGGLQYLHKWSGTWAAIPPSVIESNQPDPRESPDTDNHVCASEMFPEIVYCAVLSSGQ